MSDIYNTIIAASLYLLILCPGVVLADKIRLAVASNFAPTLQAIADVYSSRTGHEAVLVRGSTGKLYAQIRNGAPYDAFFAADQRSVRLLEESEVGIAGSSFTYAIGKLVAWSPGSSSAPRNEQWLESDDYDHLAIANPRLAPYGRAAKQALQKLGLWDNLQHRLVRGENIGQTFQFVSSGNAQLGLIAYSQIKTPGGQSGGDYWMIPQTYYQPIQQRALLLKDEPAVQGFFQFCRSEEALKIIRDYGYHTPDADI